MTINTTLGIKAIKDLTAKELKSEYINVSESIDFGSFGTNDLRYQLALEDELCERGYEIVTTKKIIKAS